MQKNQSLLLPLLLLLLLLGLVGLRLVTLSAAALAAEGLVPCSVSAGALSTSTAG
jgi:hypothetical protein